MTYGRDGRDGRCGRRRAALVIALALTPAIAWAQDGGQVIPPEWWVRVLVGALGGAVSWAQAVIAASASSASASGGPVTAGAAVVTPASQALRATVAMILGGAAGFVVIAAPVLAGSQEAWLAWSLVAGFSGSGLLGALSARLEATAQARQLADQRQVFVAATRLLADSPDPASVQQARALLASVPK